MKKIINFIERIIYGISFLTPIIDFAIRYYVGLVFWRSGLVKLASIDSTIWLFENEYHVPLLPPDWAAYLSMGSEIGFSALLVIGLLSRFSAFALFVVNLIAVSSYPSLQESGVEWHMVWGLMLLITLFHGPGKISLDHWIWKWINKKSAAI